MLTDWKRHDALVECLEETRESQQPGGLTASPGPPDLRAPWTLGQFPSPESRQEGPLETPAALF